MDGPLPDWAERTCGVCPAQELGPGQFDVVDQRGPEFAYDREIGWRVSRDGVAVCVHPYRVGLPPGQYASAGKPVPDLSPAPIPPSAAALELPTELDDLEGWLVATLRTVEPERMFTAVARAERQAKERFAPGAVVQALRRVLSVELAQR
ncbi:hypothetical protein ACN27G_28940 [Plantactinospora sp. WMMB334]|uniref:hypothetical protein n=1 Tax=Plantactinospora sp. WMMB334 TaxID=3404119 RepID=UPI003B95EB2E